MAESQYAPGPGRSGLAKSLLDAVRVDRTALRPGPAAKAAAGVIIPMIVGVAVNQPAAGAAASFGALSVGVALVTAGPRPPIGTLLAASLGMGAATFIGSVSGLVPPVHLIVLAACGSGPTSRSTPASSRPPGGSWPARTHSRRTWLTPSSRSPCPPRPSSRARSTTR
jgi:hypothetical protein